MNCIQLIPQKETPQKCEFSTYLCLEQPQTIDYLDYLSLGKDPSEGPSVVFNSDHDDHGRKAKKAKRFSFTGIFDKKDKIHYFWILCKEVCGRALAGENQTIMLYGTDEKCKDKLLFGESQNPGLFLCLLSEIFEHCHRQAIEDFVTVKLCCSIFKNATFIEIFTQQAGVELGSDPLEGCIFHTIPEIIIRNVKTGLKIVNIILKSLLEMREEDTTENLILTIKLELDCHKTDEDETRIYCLSRINFIKFANPSVNNSLKGVNKNNIWFINLLNMLQKGKEQQHSPPSIDDLAPALDNCDRFTAFLGESILKDSSHLSCLVSLNNKMTSNECLTALLFSSHLSNQIISPKKFFIDLPFLSVKIQRLQKSVMERVQAEMSKGTKKIEQWAKLSEYMHLVEQYVSEFNYLEYEYSLLVGEACEKLNKYIFTEELEDFFYAKKIHLEPVHELKHTYKGLSRIRNSLYLLRKRILSLCQEPEDKAILEELMKYYFSLAHHFLYEANAELTELLLHCIEMGRASDPSKIEPMNEGETYDEEMGHRYEEDKDKDPKKSPSHLSQIEESKMDEEESKQSLSNAQKVERRSPIKYAGCVIDNLEGMFRNKNVSLKKWNK